MLLAQLHCRTCHSLHCRSSSLRHDVQVPVPFKREYGDGQRISHLEHVGVLAQQSGHRRLALKHLLAVHLASKGVFLFCPGPRLLLELNCVQASRIDELHHVAGRA